MWPGQRKEVYSFLVTLSEQLTVRSTSRHEEIRLVGCLKTKNGSLTDIIKKRKTIQSRLPCAAYECLVSPCLRSTSL